MSLFNNFKMQQSRYEGVPKNSTDNKTCKRQTGHSGDTSEGSTGADHCVQTGSDTRMSTVAHFLENVVVLIRATNTQTRTVS